MLRNCMFFIKQPWLRSSTRRLDLFRCKPKEIEFEVVDEMKDYVKKHGKQNHPIRIIHKQTVTLTIKHLHFELGHL